MSDRWRYAILSLLVPGAGQLAQARPLAGLSFLAGTLAAMLGLALADSWNLPGALPLGGLVLVILWAPVDAWRHAAR